MSDPSTKLVSLPEAEAVVAHARASGRRIVFTNGCFDILHAEHVKLLAQARALGDLLIVGLNTDASVRRIKGGPRPINSQTERTYVLSSVQYVDHLVLFDEDTPCELIARLRPDVLVKGSDYRTDQVVGADIVAAYGGQVRIVDTDRGVSTTGLIERILDRYWKQGAAPHAGRSRGHHQNPNAR